MRHSTLQGIHDQASLAPSGVLTMRHRLQMRRVDAVPHAAEMIWLQPVRDRADQQLVGEPMGEDYTMAIPEVPIAIADPRCYP